MISIEEARKWTLDKSFALSEEMVKVKDALGRVLAHDVVTDLPQPSFRNSAMDGYAMLRSDLDAGLRKFVVAGEIQAGKSGEITVKPGEAYRIFTGAVVPVNADMVVIQEKTDRGTEEVVVNVYDKSEKSNIREVGEQLKLGEVALEGGHLINPASIGLFYALGISECVVHRLPEIAVITTGNELKKQGEELAVGEIYESNSVTLEGALHQHGFKVKNHFSIDDNFDHTVEQIRHAIREHDVLILTGGISVGDYDFVKAALERNGIEEVFYKVNQKPGKPMFFGVKAEKLVFALPGNPASMLVCYYEYVLSALKKLKGLTEGIEPECRQLPLKNSHDHSGQRPEFLRGRIIGEEVEILKGQSSFMLKSFAEANCLVYIQGENRHLEAGTPVEVHPIF